MSYTGYVSIILKYSSALECYHHIISLMCHITKLILRIIMKRIRDKIEQEISDKQCRFIEGKVMYKLHTLKILWQLDILNSRFQGQPLGKTVRKETCL